MLYCNTQINSTDESKVVNMLSTTFSDLSLPQFVYIFFLTFRGVSVVSWLASYIVYSHTCTHWCGDVVSQRRDLLGEKRNAASVRCLLNTTGISTLLLYYITFAFLISKLVRAFVIEPTSTVCLPAWKQGVPP